MNFINTVKNDLYRYGGLQGLFGLIKGFLIPGFKYTFLVRLSNCGNSIFFLKPFVYFFLRFYSRWYGFQISSNVSIGRGFYIGHFGTIVINDEAKIGENCNIGHLVTIGQQSRGSKIGSPIIGDHVWIGTGSVVVGKIHIGNNVLIAPNSFINFDVPDNSIVIGNPGKIIPKNDATDGYINFVLTK